jgi:hypothetical protein
VRILQWEVTHNDPLCKALTMPLLLYYVDYLLFSYYVIYINYVVV